jgi:hypothetical protein
MILTLVEAVVQGDLWAAAPHRAAGHGRTVTTPAPAPAPAPDDIVRAPLAAAGLEPDQVGHTTSMFANVAERPAGRALSGVKHRG